MDESEFEEKRVESNDDASSRKLEEVSEEMG